MIRSHPHSVVLALLVLTAAPCSLGGQEPASDPAGPDRSGTHAAARQAAETITSASVADRIAFLASDALRGRATPSPGLDSAAAHLVRTYRELGLEPGGEEGGYYQRFPFLHRRLNAERVALEVPSLRGGADLVYGEDYAVDGGTDGTLEAGVATAGTDADVASPGAGVRGRLLFVPTPGSWSRDFRIRAGRQARMAEEAGAAAVVHVLDPGWGPDAMAGLARSGRGDGWYLGTDPGFPRLYLTREAARRILGERPNAGAVLGGAGTAGGGPVEGVRLALRIPREVLERASPPNVAAVVPGSDPELAREYVILSAHLDHVGVGAPVEGDSIYNGADDNASGTAALVEVARAMTRLPDGPRRSVLFLHVSGEERGLLGSRWYSDHPTVPLERVVANVNVDMVASDLHRDSVVVIGKDYSSLGAAVDGVHRRLPELGLIPSDDIWPEQRFFFRSDHFNFARKEIPALFFFTGVHECYHRPCDELDFVDTGKAARVARLIFHTVLEVANADERPAWDPEGLAQVRALTR